MRLINKTVLLICILFGSVAHAEQSKALGDWEVHYMVLNSTFLTPQVANAYAIKRSNYNALINISVLDKSDKTAQSVAIMGSATNLLGTEKKLNFKQVEEGEAIYYLAELSYRDQEQYRFQITITRGNQTQTLKFEQKLYTE